jgi:hypothetical protein
LWERVDRDIKGGAVGGANAFLIAAVLNKAGKRGKGMSLSAQFSSQECVTEESIGERRLWMAVVAMAVEDWRTGALRSQREAQRFLFENNEDFNAVCASAGLDPSSLRSKLLRIGHRVEMESNWRGALRDRLVA